jgi:hypothetical protein
MKRYHILLLAIGLLLIIGVFSIDFVAKKITEQQIEKIQKQFEGKYDFTYGDLSVSVVKRTVVLTDFTFNSNVDSTGHKLKVDLTLDRLYLKLSSYVRMVVNGNIDLRKVSIDNPSISYGIVPKHNPSKKVQTLDSTKLATNDLFLKKIIVEEFELENGYGNFYPIKDPAKKILLIDDLDIYITQVEVDIESEDLTTSTTFDDFIWTAHKVSNNALPNHRVSIENIHYDANNKGFEISGIQFINKVGKEEFNKNREFRAPWIDLKMESILFNVHPLHFYQDGIFKLGTIELVNPEITIYVDLNHPLTPDVKPMPSKMIRDIKPLFHLDSLILHNGTFIFLPKMKGENPGMVKLSEINGEITEVTNVDSLLVRDPNFYVDLETRIWDEGKVDLSLVVNVADYDDPMHVVGTVQDLQLKKAENMILNLFGVGVESGYLHYLHFDYEANDYSGQGSLIFNYTDLKFDLKKKDKDQHGDDNTFDEHKSKKFLNKIVESTIRESNMPTDPKYKSSGFIYHERTRHKAFSALLWECIQTGITDVVIKDSYFDARKKHNRDLNKYKKSVEKEQKKKNKQNTRKSKKNREN